MKNQNTINERDASALRRNNLLSQVKPKTSNMVTRRSYIVS
jgi:hypothetical protein